MSKISAFLRRVADDSDRIERELKDFQEHVSEAGNRADVWAQKQLDTLKADYVAATEMANGLVEKVERSGEAAISHAYDEASQHWEALGAAIAEYREKLGDSKS